MKIVQKVLFLVFLSLLGLSALGQTECPQNRADALSMMKGNAYIAVEGYYVDNSSFFVTHSSDPLVEVNTRYPIYEYTSQVNLYLSKQAAMTEAPAHIKPEVQGGNKRRILFLNKKQTTKSQLVINENSVLGMPIEGDMVEYIRPDGGIIDSTPLSDLRELLFYKSLMP